MDNTLSKEIWIRSTIEDVYDCFTKSEAMLTWHGKEVELNPIPGGIYRVLFEDGTLILGQFIEVDPYRRLLYSARYNDIDSWVEIHFYEEGNGVKVKIQQKFRPAQDSSSFNYGWDYFLGILKRLKS